MAPKAAFAALAVVLLLTQIFAQAPIDGAEDLQKIVDCLSASGQHTIFLRHLNRSGFQSVLGKYLGQRAITLLVPTDEAFREMPKRLSGKLMGKDRILFIEFHMLRELWPAAYMRGILNSAFFETVMSDRTDGPFVYMCDLGDADTICLSSQKEATNETVSVIVKPDACGLPTRTIAAQVINRVLIPPGLFQDQVA